MNLSWTQRAMLFGKALTGNWDLKEGSQGYTMLKGILPGSVGAPPTRGTEAQLRGYGQLPWVRAVASRVGHAVSAVPWKLYAIKGKPTVGTEKRDWVKAKGIQLCGDRAMRKSLLARAEDEDSLTQITDHPLLDLLYDGNPLFSGIATRKVIQIHHDLVGESFLLKERGPLTNPDTKRNVPTALWPIPPHWIISTPTPTNMAFRISFRGWQGFIPASEILWSKELDPAMPYWRGSGVAQALSDELETDEYTAKYLKQFFYNSARPDLIVSPQGEMASFGEDEMARLEQAWLQEHQGFWRAFKPMFVSRPVDVQLIEGNFRQLQLKDIRSQTRDICMQVWGVPPEILGVLESSNRATIDAAGYLFAKYVVEPRLEFWRIEYQRQFVPEYDDRLILDYDSPVREDEEFNAGIMKACPWAFEIDEIREAGGQPPLENDLGTAHMEPTTMTRVMTWDAPDPKPNPMDLLAQQHGNGPPMPMTPPIAPPKESAQEKFSALDDDQLLAYALQEARQERRT